MTDTVGQLVKRSPLLQWTTVKARRSTRKVLFDSAQVLPSALEDLGSGTTSLDPYAYNWDYPDNSALSVLRTENFNMLKQGTKFYIRRGHDSTTKFVFEVKNNPKKPRGYPTDIHPTNCDSFNAAVSSGNIDLRSGRNLCQWTEWCHPNLTVLSTHWEQWICSTLCLRPKHMSHKTSDEDMYLIRNYGTHMGMKLDYLFFQSSWKLQASELQPLKSQCEQERTQTLTILMLSFENPRLAGYNILGNRSMFLQTDGCLAWLYHCPIVHLPLHSMNQCYHRNPIVYEGQIQFVDPITWQTNPAVNSQNFATRIKISAP